MQKETMFTHEFKRDEEESSDPFLELSGQNRPSFLKLILMIVVIGMLISLISDYREEIEYYFKSDVPVDLGEIHDYPSLREKDPKAIPKIENNTYVKLRGIPLQRSQSARSVFFKLVGDDIFVQTTREQEDELAELSRTRSAEEITGSIDRSYYDGYGRILSFSKLPGRYNGIRRYYAQNYAETFCETLTEEARREKEKQRRDAILADWKSEYNELSEEERKTSHMGPEPSEEELSTLMSANPLCINAYLVQNGKKPSDFIWYIIGTGAAILFILLNIGLIFRWFIRYFKS